MVLIDDFEDGDIVVAGSAWSGWSGDTGNFSAISGSPIAGSFSGQLSLSGTQDNVFAERSSETTQGVQFQIRPDTDTDDTVDVAEIIIRDLSGFEVGKLTFEHDTNDIVWEGSSNTVLQTWSVGTTYTVALEFNFATDNTTIDIDGTSYGPYSNAASTSGWGRFLLNLNSNSATVTATIDDVETTILAAPTLSVDATRDTEVDVSWTAVDNADEYALYRSEASGTSTSDTLVTTTASTSATDTGLENGERYYYIVEARDTSGTFDSETSNEADGTTTLPAPTIDSTTPDSTTAITVAWTLNDNSADGDVDVIDNGSPAATVAIGTTSYQLTGLSEATQHDIEVRRSTDHTSSTSAVDTQYTEPAAPTGASGSVNEAAGTVTVTWTDNSSGEDAHQIERERDGGPWTDDGSVGANTTTYDSAELDRLDPYRFRVRATVSSGDSFAASSWATTSTLSFPTYANYWAVVQPPGGSDTVLTTTIESGPTYEHTALNHYSHGLGESVVSITDWFLADIEVYLDSERLFRGTVLKLREDNPTEGTTTVVGYGPGLELRQTAPSSVPVTYQNDSIADILRDYYQNQMPGVDIDATVYDPPVATVDNDTLVISDQFVTFASIFSVADDEPLDNSTSLQLLPTCFIGVEDDFSQSVNSNYTVGSDVSGSGVPHYIDGEYAAIDSPGEVVALDITPQHDIPESRVSVAVHGNATDTSGTTSTGGLSINGYTIEDGGVVIGSLPSTSSNGDWVRYEGEYFGSDLTAGTTYTCELEAGDFGANIDALCVYDTDYTPGTFDSPDSFGDTIDGPRPHQPVSVEATSEQRAYIITEGRIESTWNDTTNGQELALSNDGGTNYLTATNTSTQTADFDGNSLYNSNLQPRVTLDGFGSNTYLSDGVNGQEITSVDVYLTTQRIPAVGTEAIELTGTHEENLQRLHREAEMRYVIDPTNAPPDPISIESFAADDPAVQQSVTWTQLNEQQTRDGLGYANAVTILYTDSNGDAQEFVLAADQDEVSRVGEEVRVRVPKPNVSTVDGARRAAVNEQRKRIAEDSRSGVIRAVATPGVLPGYPYNIPAFGGLTPLDDAVEYVEGADNVEMTLRFLREADPFERQRSIETDVDQLKRD